MACNKSSEGGYQHIVVYTVDTDVLILLLAYSYLLIESGAICILVQFGVGYDVRFYDIVELQNEIGAKNCWIAIFHVSVDVIPHQAFPSMGSANFGLYGLSLS